MSDRLGACRVARRIARRTARRTGLGLALLVAGALGPGPESAAGSVLIEWNNARLLVRFEDGSPPPAELGATISIVGLGDPKALVAELLARELETRAGGNASFGRSTFSWLDEDGNEIRPTLPPLRDEIPDDFSGVLPPLAPGSLGGTLGGVLPRAPEPVRIVGRPSYVWVDADGHPVPPQLGVALYPVPRASDYFDSDVADASWNTLLLLVSSSCVGEDDPACFDPRAPVRADGCSFNAPLLCDGLQGLVAPWRPVPVEVAGLRIKAKRGNAALRVSGRVDLSELALEAGSFSVAIGGMRASIPLEEFQRRGRQLVWKRRGDGLRAIVLRDDGRFRIVGRRLDAEHFAADALAVVLQLGDGLAATSVPLP